MKRIEALADEERTIILYESPFRVVKALEQLGEVLGMEREVAVSREITKMFEESVRGTIGEVAEHFRQHAPKGEFVIVVAGRSTKRNNRDADECEE